MVAGNIYLQCDGLGEVGVLIEAGGLTVEGRRGVTFYNVSNREQNEKLGWGSNDFIKEECWVIRRVP